MIPFDYIHLFLCVFFTCSVDHRDLHSFPTRRSSDLVRDGLAARRAVRRAGRAARDGLGAEDRKSTRLNSSHANISYAVFCLKKKKKKLIVNLNLKVLNIFN